MTTVACPLPQELHRRILEATSRRIRRLEVEVREDVVLILGETDSFYVKQLAQEAVRRMLKFVRVRNLVVVHAPTVTFRHDD